MALVEKIAGGDKWSGESPLEIQIVDTNDNLAYLLQIRNGDDWITIQKQAGNNPALVKSVCLDNKSGSWKYTDPYMIKYQDYSLTDLQDFHRLLAIAEEASRPNQIE